MFNAELMKKIFVVIFGLAIFRMGSHIPVPGIDPMVDNLSTLVVCYRSRLATLIGNG